MKKSILLFVLMVSVYTATYAQRSKAILFFKDGTEKEGFGKLNSQKQIKFRTERKAEVVKYSFDVLDRAKIYTNNGIHEYTLRMVKGDTVPTILEIVKIGRISLYKKVKEGMNTMQYGNGYGQTMSMHHYSIKNYYVQKEGEEMVTHLGSTGLFSKNFKKAASNYFGSCPKLAERINNKELKKSDILEIVRLYNKQCE